MTVTTSTLRTTVPTMQPPQRARRYAFSFWMVAAAFLVNMGFSAVPTPLYVLYQRRDHFSTFTVTLVFAVYAVGVIASLYLGGHISDWAGRKRVLIPAILTNVLAAAIFLAAPSLAGLLLARVVSGVSVGLTTATATAYLADLHVHADPRHRRARRGQVVATAANLGGIGVGPLVAGLLAQYAPQPLRLPYDVFGALLIVLAVLLPLAPETVARPEPPPTWRPQHIAVPPQRRGTFFAATALGGAALAVYGVLTSLAPNFLAATLNDSSHAVAGAVAFAAFAAGVLAQLALSRLGVTSTLRTGGYLLIPGLALLVVGMWLPSLAVFIVGAVVAGGGAGLLFRGAVAAAGSAAPPLARAEVLAGYFLGSYAGLALPVLALGVATQFVTARAAMLVFVAFVSVTVVGSVRTVIEQHQGPRASTNG